MFPIAVVSKPLGLGSALTSRAVIAVVSSARTIAREVDSIAVSGE
jgi:hypothetical protein